MCTGLSETFRINKEDGRPSDFQLSIVQESGILPIGMYYFHEKKIVLYENVRYYWADGTTQVPDEMPWCHGQSCYVVSTSILTYRYTHTLHNTHICW